MTRTGMAIHRLGLAAAAAAVATTLVACFDPDCCAVTDAPPSSTPTYVDVAFASASVNRDVDVLFVIDDSPGTLHLQMALTDSFPTFVALMSELATGLPNLHIGVVSPDLGTKGADDSTAAGPIGSGPGSCSGFGKAGNLQTNGTTLISGNFIRNTANTDGTRSTNYTGDLASAFSAIASLGSAGCGFEQPIEAAKRAVNNNPFNAGFIRPSAALAIVLLNDEDDCSLAHASLLAADTTLGPLQSFRCTRYGVMCDDGGKTPDEMNEVGMKARCHSNESSAYLTQISDHAGFFSGLKSDPRQVYVASLAGPPAPVVVELLTPPGGGAAVSALSYSCQWTLAGGSPAAADPAVRLDEFARSFARHTSETVCTTTLASQLTSIALQVRGLAGDTCLVRDIALPAECLAFERRGGVETPMPPCETSSGGDCYQLVADTAACTAGQHLRLEVQRQMAPPPGAVVSLRCTL